MDENERRLGLFRTPPHIVKALLKRERFRGTISDPAAGEGTLCGRSSIAAIPTFSPPTSTIGGSPLQDQGLPDQHHPRRQFRHQPALLSRRLLQHQAEVPEAGQAVGSVQDCHALPLGFETHDGVCSASTIRHRLPIEGDLQLPADYSLAERPKAWEQDAFWVVRVRAGLQGACRPHESIIFRKNNFSTSRATNGKRKVFRNTIQQRKKSA